MPTALEVPPTRPRSATVERRRPRWPLLVCAPYALLAAAAVLAWVAVGDRSWTLPVNVTTFWWSLPGVPLMLLAARRRLDAAALLSVPAGIFLWSYASLFFGAPPAADGDLRVASFNTYVRAPDLSHVVALVHDARPDLLLVQEIMPSQAAALKARLADHLPHSWFGEPGKVGGVGLLSRHPLVGTRPIPPLSPVSRRTAVIVVDVAGRGRIQVVPVHLTSPCPSCGDSVVARQAFEASTRREEIDAILAVLDPSLPAIVGGDFNSTQRNDPYRHLAAAGFRDPQVEAGSGPGFTWPAGSAGAGILERRPLVRIDWVLARGLVPAAARVGYAGASDHRPVIADLAWP